MQDTALLPRLQNQDRSVSTSSGLRAPDRIQVSLWQLPEGHIAIVPCDNSIAVLSISMT